MYKYTFDDKEQKKEFAYFLQVFCFGKPQILRSSSFDCHYCAKVNDNRVSKPN